jgi:hypothetical protein
VIVKMDASHTRSRLRLYQGDKKKVADSLKKKTAGDHVSGGSERKAATYSRASYTCTTIGKTTFDGRVREGIGSDSRFLATKFFENYMRKEK